MSLNLTYPDILQYFQRQIDQGRTESRAFLTWFLEHYYRLEEDAADDAVCDGPDDKGVDGIYVDKNLEQIVVLQAKLFQNVTKTIGDGTLRTFAGSLAQFDSKEGVQHVAETTSNVELANLLASEKVPELVENGYVVKGVFVTNGLADANAKAFLAAHDAITLFDGDELQGSFVPTGPSAPVSTPVTFDVSGYDVIEHVTAEARAIFAPVAATDLIRLAGLANGELFVWNVRQSLGRTKVNREIARSMSDQTEHKNFLLYHNGLTILCESIETNDGQITISGYNAVNGCQSLTSLYDNRANVSPDLRLLARLVQLRPDSDLATKITHHSNNQNSISARDLQSNSAIQRRLQNEFNRKFAGEVFYKIKRGETALADEVLENETVAKMLLAFDVEQPWSCHQSYKLFDELHADIFARPEVTADRIWALANVFFEVEIAAQQLDNRLMANYALTRFFLMFLFKQAIEQDDAGADFIRNPSAFLNANDGVRRIRQTVRSILEDLIVDVNGELRERDENDEPIDYKRELKSPTAVRKLARDVISVYQKAVKRGRADSFGDEWIASE